jgi:hypothetical protein
MVVVYHGLGRRRCRRARGPRRAGEDDIGERQQGSAGVVEVVAVVVVAEQDRVDWAEVVGGDRGAGQLRELEPQPKV